MNDVYLCTTALGNIKLAGCNIKASMCCYSLRIQMTFMHTSFFYEILITCCIIWLSTLASKTKHNQYHRDQNASKTNTTLPWFLLS